MEKYLDAALSAEERAGDLLEKMSLEEKMGQVNCVFPFSGMMDLVRETIQKSHGIGQISTLDMRMCDSLEEAVAWQRDLQKTAMEASEHHIPAVFHMEGLSGAFIPDAVSFPSGIPRPKSLTVTFPASSMSIFTFFPNPIANSSMQLSTTSFSRTYIPSP